MPSVVIVGITAPAPAIIAQSLPCCDCPHSSLLCHFCSQGHAPRTKSRAGKEGAIGTLRAIAAHVWLQQSFPASPGAEHGTIGDCVTTPITLTQGPIRVDPGTDTSYQRPQGKASIVNWPWTVAQVAGLRGKKSSEATKTQPRARKMLVSPKLNSGPSSLQEPEPELFLETDLETHSSYGNTKK